MDSADDDADAVGCCFSTAGVAADTSVVDDMVCYVNISVMRCASWVKDVLRFRKRRLEDDDDDDAIDYRWWMDMD